MQNVQNNAMQVELAVEASVSALHEKASNVVQGAVWGAMSFMAPRLKWSRFGALGFEGAAPTSAPPRPKVQVPSFAEVQAQADELGAENVRRQ